MSFLSKNIRFLRKKANLNQDQISLLFNKKANTIGNWENQKSEPSLAELIKLGDYFKVSTADLLQTDLESLSQGKAGQQYPAKQQKLNTPFSESSSGTPEASSGISGDGNPDAFWLILREIRALNEKVDLLISGMETTGSKRNSDKSYH